MSFTVNLRDDLPDEIKDLIARISVRHGQLEHVLTMTIKRTSPSRSLSEAMARAQYLLNQPAFTEEAMQTYGKDTDDQEVEAEFLEVRIALAKLPVHVAMLTMRFGHTTSRETLFGCETE